MGIFNRKHKEMLRDGVQLACWKGLLTINVVNNNDSEKHIKMRFDVARLSQFFVYDDLEVCSEDRQKEIIRSKKLETTTAYDYMKSLPLDKVYRKHEVGKFMPVLVFKVTSRTGEVFFEFWTAKLEEPNMISLYLTLSHDEMRRLCEYAMREWNPAIGV